MWNPRAWNWTFLQAATQEISTLKLHVWRSVWDKWLLVEPSCAGFFSKLGDIWSEKWTTVRGLFAEKSGQIFGGLVETKHSILTKKETIQWPPNLRIWYQGSLFAKDLLIKWPNWDVYPMRKNVRRTFRWVVAFDCRPMMAHNS